MKLPALLLLCASSLAGAGPTAEIATDGIRLGWRFGNLHPFVSGEFEFKHESSSYQRWIDDSLTESEEDDFWWYPEWVVGAGIDWQLLAEPVQGGLRAETKYATNFNFGDAGSFTLTSRIGPLLEKRCDHLVFGASWAPALEWWRYEYDGTYPIPGGVRRIKSESSRVRITSSTELHLRYEF